MEKRGLLIGLSILFLSSVKAQFFGYGSYGSFSISNFINTLDPATVVYGLLFFIFFTIIFLTLSRLGLFKTKGPFPWSSSSTNSSAAGVLSFSISALIVYYLYRSGYNIEYMFYNLGFSGSLGSIILVLLLIGLAVLIIIKFKLKGFLIMAGTLMVLTAIFTDLIYEKGIALIIGFVLILIGILLWTKFKPKTF